MAAFETQTHHAILWQIRQRHVIRQRVFPVFNLVGKKRLPHTRRHHHPINIRCDLKMLQQQRQNLLLEHVFHFKRHSRHRDKHRFSFLKPHTRRRAITVRDIFACLRYKRLPTVALGHLITT